MPTIDARHYDGEQTELTMRRRGHVGPHREHPRTERPGRRV